MTFNENLDISKTFNKACRTITQQIPHNSGLAWVVKTLKYAI
jgi:hypothetical protein